VRGAARGSTEGITRTAIIPRAGVLCVRRPRRTGQYQVGVPAAALEGSREAARTLASLRRLGQRLMCRPPLRKPVRPSSVGAAGSRGVACGSI